jgi:hypothetical protein
MYVRTPPLVAPPYALAPLLALSVGFLKLETPFAPPAGDLSSSLGLFLEPLGLPGPLFSISFKFSGLNFKYSRLLLRNYLKFLKIMMMQGAG